MTIWKQGQFYPELGKKVIELPNKVASGPSDPMIKIDGFHVSPDQNGNFVEGGEVDYTEDELDAIHTYAIIRMVINMYEDLLGKPIHWSWWKNGKGDPLLVKIRNNDINARYVKAYKSIELDFYGPFENWTYNCRSVDLIAHEAGHAVLDSIMPQFMEGDVEARGIGEAFCDLTAMFWILSQKDLCDYVTEETGGDLTKNSILTLFGVGYGYQENQFKELRSALNNVKYSNNNKISYDYGQVLVGILYQILIDLYVKNKKLYTNDSDNLFNSGQDWMKALAAVFIKTPLNFQNFGWHLDLELLSSEIEIKKHFKNRGIF